MRQSTKYYLNQNYELIKKSCRLKNELFVDKTFAADESSIYRNVGSKFDDDRVIYWKRPSEFCDNPVFLLNNFQSSNLIQGSLGNCWFISAASSICSQPELANKIIPPDQTVDKNNVDYTGVFRFRFWHHGDWVEVVVDDLLPVDEHNELIFCRDHSNPNQLFGPLMEKAYAKLNRCYELLSGGNLIDALIDLTGGVHESFKLAEYRNSSNRDHLWEVIFASFSMGSFGGAIIKTRSEANKNNDFLSSGHSYCVLKPFEIISDGKEYNKLRQSSNDINAQKPPIRLIRMKNPWGEDAWAGKWSRFSFEWTTLSKQLQNQLNGDTKSNGLFYISFEDFVEHFDEFYLVHTDLNTFNYSSTSFCSDQWLCEKFEGEWNLEKGTAGGCGNEDTESFWCNPKYIIKSEASLENNKDTNVNKDQNKLIISLIQTEQVRKRMESDDGSYENSVEPIGFSLFSIISDTNDQQQFPKSFNPNICQRIDTSGIYLYKREVNKEVLLNTKANYLLIVSVFDKDVSLKYVLRIFHQSSQRISIIDLNNSQQTVKSYQTKQSQSGICSIL